MRALLVGDDPQIAFLLAAELGRQGFAIDHARRLDEATAALRLATYLLVLIDRQLPDGDGMTMIADTRHRQPAASILVTSALGSTADRVSALDAGADDYLSKPFEVDELRARISSSLRRATPLRPRALRCGALEFCPVRREFTIDGAPLDLRRRELSLLAALITRAGRIVSRETLIREVYSFDDEPSSNTLEAHVSRLRRRLEASGAGVVIHSARGIGYRICAAASAVPRQTFPLGTPDSDRQPGVARRT